MVMGYVDRPSAEPGSSLALHVRASGERWTARAVRLLALEIPSAGVERREQPVDAIAPVARESIEQLTPVGSFVRAEAGTADLAAGLTVAAVAMPTRPGAGPQAIVAGGGWALGLDDAGIPTLWLDGDVAVATSTPLVRGCWVLLAAAADPSRDEVRIAALPVGTLASNRVVEGSPPDSASTPFTGAVYWEASTT